MANCLDRQSIVRNIHLSIFSLTTPPPPVLAMTGHLNPHPIQIIIPTHPIRPKINRIFKPIHYRFTQPARLTILIIIIIIIISIINNIQPDFKMATAMSWEPIWTSFKNIFAKHGRTASTTTKSSPPTWVAMDCWTWRIDAFNVWSVNMPIRRPRCRNWRRRSPLCKLKSFLKYCQLSESV